jgi:hypothetical protein
MKKIKDSFELVFLVIFLLFAFQGFTEKKKKKFSKLKLCSIILTFIGILWLGYTIYDAKHPFADCAPATMSRIFPEYNVKQMRAICKTERDGTIVQDLMDGWKKVSTNDLNIVYRHEEIVEGKSKQLRFGLDKTYMWFGILQSGGHCALIKFTPEEVTISNSDYLPGTTNYFLVSMTYEEFFDKTYFVLEAPELNNVRFK